MMFTWCPQPRVRSCERSNTAHSNCAVKHGCTGCNCPMPQGPKPGQGGAPHTPKQSTVKHKHSKSNSDATRVTCYPRAGVSHVTLGRACHMLPRAKQSKGKQSRGKQSKGKQKQSNSSCDAMRGPCYPSARLSRATLNQAVMLRVAHVTPVRAYRMAPSDARLT